MYRQYICMEAVEDRYALPETLLLAPRRNVTSLSEKAYHLLRDRIITLDLPPGATIEERRLMAELGLGRTPIREALRRLADERLVEVVPRRGMFVTHIEIRDLAAISEVRVELEGRAGRLAAERATREQRAAAGLLHDLLTTERPNPDHRELMRLDQRIHRHVHDCAHNAYLAETLDEYLVLSLRLWFLVLDRLAALPQAVAEHRDLLAAVRDGDGDRAEATLRAHVTGFEQAIRASL